MNCRRNLWQSLQWIRFDGPRTISSSFSLLSSFLRLYFYFYIRESWETHHRNVTATRSLRRGSLSLFRTSNWYRGGRGTEQSCRMSRITLPITSMPRRRKRRDRVITEYTRVIATAPSDRDRTKNAWPRFVQRPTNTIHDFSSIIQVFVLQFIHFFSRLQFFIHFHGFTSPWTIQKQFSTINFLQFSLHCQNNHYKINNVFIWFWGSEYFIWLQFHENATLVEWIISQFCT